jgi:N-acetylglucosaminyldiphosphoundecaprenol N-acetyl-beta-D-mannosaminyltransferase
MLGLPIDSVDMEETVQLLLEAVQNRNHLFLSTPNLNFLIGSQTNQGLRASVIASDLSVADGMPLVWIAKLLRLPISERVSGSNLFERLLQPPLPIGASNRGWLSRLFRRSQPKPTAPNSDLFQRFLRAPRASGQRGLRVYFFGGPPGVAAQAHGRINALGSAGLRSVGFACPGFGTLEDMSSDELIGAINATNADILIVALGAAKGQAWIKHNLRRLNVPVVSHLGAVVNFAAGTVSRAPVWMQRSGLEWLWRIKEEPELWQRYWHDGRVLLSVLFSRLLPYALWQRWGEGRTAGQVSGCVSINVTPQAKLQLTGDVVGPLDDATIQIFCDAAAVQQTLVVDLATARILGAACWAQLLLLRYRIETAGHSMKLEGVSEKLRQQMRWNGVADL